MRLQAVRPVRVFLFAAVVLLAGCTASGETAIVTERPERVPSTENTPAPSAQPGPVTAGGDTATAGRFDQGRMWTFEDLPLDYFDQEYGFRPGEDWLRQARLGALRFADFCSASFVSPRGLIMTNHHCAREGVYDVSEEGEDLVEDGFYADEREAERRVNDLYVEQVVEVRNVTDSLEALVAGRRDNDIEAIAEARQQQAAQLQERLTRQAKRQDTTLRVRVVPLYDGARFSAYTLRRYHDVRLVMAPERDLGFYGGTADNFTYPRYALDVAFFRAYTPEGEPVRENIYFPFSRNGAEEGDAVFVVGNPGTTSRLSTSNQLMYQRDVGLPQRLDVLRTRTSILRGFVEDHPADAEEYDLENTLFSLENALKATRGELRGLRDPYLLARRRAGEQAALDSLGGRSDSLRQRYGQSLREIERIQSAKRSAARQAEAFEGFLNPRLGSHLLSRALYGYYYATIQRRPGVPEEELSRIRREALRIENWPKELERQYITARLRQLRERLGASDPTVRRALDGASPQAVAERLVNQSALVDSAGFAKVLEAGYFGSGDPSVPVIRPLASLFLETNRQQRDFAFSENALGARLARTLLAAGPGPERRSPDATFSLRLADGRVKGYEYNGTRAPPHTTFYGLYDHFASYRLAPEPNEAWDLPERWQTPPASFERATPFNLASTNDIAGGNSGSPLLNRDLEVVGLVFDSNVEAFPTTFLYRRQTARAISVDARGILEALEEIYEAERLIGEITGSMRARTEPEASRVAPGE